jgi:ABC-type uncharacterized transport system auxiliary subunit
MRLPAALLGSLALLAGCSGLLHSNVPPEQNYYLRAAAVPAGSVATGAASLPVSLRVAHPLADPGLDSSHIMLLQSDHRMSYYTGARWPAAMPELVSSLTVQTLRASGNWASVQDSASPFPSDYLLQITVRRFDADYTEVAAGAAPTVHVVFDCIVGRRAGREVLSTFVVAGSAAASANRLGEVVAAFEQASATALAALTQQTLEATRADAAQATQNAAAPAPSSSRHSQ